MEHLSTKAIVNRSQENDAITASAVSILEGVASGHASESSGNDEGESSDGGDENPDESEAKQRENESQSRNTQSLNDSVTPKPVKPTTKNNSITIKFDVQLADLMRQKIPVEHRTNRTFAELKSMFPSAINSIKGKPYSRTLGD